MNHLLRAVGIERLFLIGRDILDLWRGVLLVGRPPTLGLLCLPRLERVVSVVGMRIVAPALISIMALVYWAVLEVMCILSRLLRLSILIIA